jgi:hypothetical protein
MPRLRVRPRQVTPEEAITFDSKKSARLRVMDPMTMRPLSDAGASVVQSSYWVRRLRCGDVEEVKPASRTRGKSGAGSQGE